MIVDLNFAKTLLAAFIAYVIIFFIALRIQNNANYLKKALLCLIVGGALTTLSVGALLLDYLAYQFESNYLEVMSRYFAFPIMAVVFTIVLPLVFYLIGKSRNQQFVNLHQHYTKEYQRRSGVTKQKPTIKQEIEYLYLGLHFEDKYYLKEIIKDEGTEYGGLVVKFPNDEFFHDEFIKRVIDELALDTSDYHLAGTAIQKKNDTKNNKYYVYQIELNSLPEKMTDLKGVSPVVLYGYNLSEFNKKILFHLVLRDYFEIEI